MLCQRYTTIDGLGLEVGLVGAGAFSANVVRSYVNSAKVYRAFSFS